MSKTGSSVTEYDWVTEKILTELRSMDGEGTTPEIRDRVGVEKSYKIRYRVNDKLEPEGFVETEQPPAEPGNTPPKIVRLTSRGEGLADQLLDADDSEDLSISGELEQVRARLNKIETSLDEQSDVSGDGEFETLLEHLDDVTQSDAQEWTGESLAEEINALRQGMYGMRDYLLNNTEMSEDDLESAIQNWQNNS